jgi:hypothetical protein
MRLTEKKVVSRKCLPDVRHKVGDALAPGQWQAIALFPELTIKCQKSISVSGAQWREAFWGSHDWDSVVYRNMGLGVQQFGIHRRCLYIARISSSNMHTDNPTADESSRGQPLLWL